MCDTGRLNIAKLKCVHDPGAHAKYVILSQDSTTNIVAALWMAIMSRDNVEIAIRFTADDPSTTYRKMLCRSARAHTVQCVNQIGEKMWRCVDC